jgi:hypothetical protein
LDITDLNKFHLTNLKWYVKFFLVETLLVQFRHKERGRGAVCCHGSIGGKRELYSDRGRAEG